MAISQAHDHQPVDVYELASALAEMVRDEPSVLRMWVSVHRNSPSFWLLTEPMELDGERRLHRRAGDLYDRYPSTDFRLHLLNPLFYDELFPEDILPMGAEEIALGAA
jgi:hypothetical protein